jgi:hypothetical protein
VRRRKKKGKRLFRPAYVFGRDVHKLVKRAGKVLKHAEKRLAEDLKARRREK